MTELNAMINDAKFGDASAMVVVEQFLTGIEMSVFVLTDGKNYLILPTAKDYKRIGEGDTGLNTGGMGAISPVPFASKELMKKVEEKIIVPTINGLKKDGIIYKGFIYFGLMIVANEPYLIEYNCRMGDPETEVVIPRIENDLLDLFTAVANENIHEKKLNESAKAGCTIVLASNGYPEVHEIGKQITLPKIENDEIIFHAGTKFNEEFIAQTSGGRVLMITALSDTLNNARKVALKLATQPFFEGQYYRKDIGLDV